MRRIGLVLDWLVTLFLLVDGEGRLAGFAPYVEGLTKFGYDVRLAPWIGASLLVSTILYWVPRTTARRDHGHGLPGRRRRDAGARGRSVVPLPRRDGRVGVGRALVPEPRIRELLPLVR